MSKSCPRSLRRLKSRKATSGELVRAALSNPIKPGKSLTTVSRAFDITRTHGARAHSPDGNLFRCKHVERPQYRRNEKHLAYQARLSAAFHKALKVYHDRGART